MATFADKLNSVMVALGISTDPDRVKSDAAKADAMLAYAQAIGETAVQLDPAAGLQIGGAAPNEQQRAAVRAGLGTSFDRKPAIVKVVASNYAGSVAAAAACYGMAFGMPVKFDAIEIGFVHSGGDGAVVGMTAAIAATDDVGDRSNTNTAAGRRFATPFRAGVEKNEYSADGWSRVTVAGANSWGIADAGATNAINIAWSDLIECHAVEDSAQAGVYPLLLRVYGGTGRFTRVGQTGLADPAKWLADAGKDYVMGCFRVGAADAVGTLGSWANGGNVTFSDAALIAVVIKAYSAGQFVSIVMNGDSRFGLPAPSLEATKSYKNASFYLQKYLTDAGIKAAVAQCSRGAQTNATVYAWSEKYMEQVKPNASVYLCYSINNGVPTQALLNVEKTRVLKHVALCASKGVTPVLVPIFPYSTGFGSALSAVTEFNDWCKTLGTPFVDALTLYGDASGGWLVGKNEDANHMNDATYADFASRVGQVVSVLAS